jgi:hypothetical protein
VPSLPLKHGVSQERPKARRLTPYFLFLGLASGFFFSGSGIFTCAKPETASSKLSGCNDIGSPARPFGFGISFFILHSQSTPAVHTATFSALA